MMTLLLLRFSWDKWISTPVSISGIVQVERGKWVTCWCIFFPSVKSSVLFWTVCMRERFWRRIQVRAVANILIWKAFAATGRRTSRRIVSSKRANNVIFVTATYLCSDFTFKSTQCWFKCVVCFTKKKLYTYI